MPAHVAARMPARMPSHASSHTRLWTCLHGVWPSAPASKHAHVGRARLLRHQTAVSAPSRSPARVLARSDAQVRAHARARARVLAYHRDAGYYRGTAVRHARALTYACEHAVYLLIPVHVLPGYGSAPGEESTGARWKSLQWHLSGAQSHWCVEIVFCDSPKLIALHWQDTQDGPIVGTLLFPQHSSQWAARSSRAGTTA